MPEVVASGSNFIGAVLPRADSQESSRGIDQDRKFHAGKRRKQGSFGMISAIIFA
jgi:hypothetical protein